MNLLKKMSSDIIWMVIYVALIAVLSSFEYILDFLSNNPLNNTIITDIITITGVSITILLPVSLDIITRFSNRYNSEILTGIFTNTTENKRVTRILLFVPILIFLKLLLKDSAVNKNILHNNIILVLSVIIFIYIIIVLFRYLKFFTIYITSSNLIVKDFRKRIDKYTHTLKFVKYNKDCLITDITGLCHIMRTEIKNNNINVVEEELKYLSKKMSIIMTQIDYENALENNDFVFTKDTVIINTTIKYTSTIFDDIFIAFINNLLELNDIALQNNNNELSYSICYFINRMVEDFVIRQHFKNPLSFTLNNFNAKIFKDRMSKFTYMYKFCYGWYFNAYREPELMCLEYWDYSNKYLCQNLRILISAGNTDVIMGFVRDLHDGIHTSSYFEGFWSLNSKLIDLDREAYRRLLDNNDNSKLFSNMDKLMSKTNCLSNYNVLVQKCFDFKKFLITEYPSYEDEIDLFIDTQINKAKGIMFLTNIKYLSVHLLSFCIFKQEYEIINYLINYKQPDDTSAHYVGHEVIPQTINDIIYQMIEGHKYNLNYSFYEDHHDSDFYTTMAYALLIIISNYVFLTEYSFNSYSNYKYQDLDIILSDLNNLISAVSSEKFADLLKHITFRKKNVTSNEIVSETKTALNEFLSELMFFKNQQLIESPLLEIRIDSFKESVAKGYFNNIAKSILISKSDQTTSMVTVPIKILFNTPKKYFTDLSYFSEESNFENIGKQLYQMEERYIINDMLSSIKIISPNIETAIDENFDEKDYPNLILIAINHWKHHNKFYRHYNNDNQDREYYNFKNIKIPVIRERLSKDISECFLIVSNMDSKYFINNNLNSNDIAISFKGEFFKNDKQDISIKDAKDYINKFSRNKDLQYEIVINLLVSKNLYKIDTNLKIIKASGLE